MTSHFLHKEDGFTLIEILAIIILTGIVSVASLDVITDTMNQARFNATIQKMQQIQNAMIGDITIKESNVRTSFGFLGDIGAIATAAQGISALLAQPSPALPAYAINTTVRFGIGWNGPYISAGNSGASYLVDGWNNAFVYSPTATPPTLVSYGADGVAGGTGFNQDITFTLSTQLITSTVQGFICYRGGAFNFAAQVELNYPNGSGVLTQNLQTLTIANAGQFSYANIPLGVHSISIYQPTKAAPVLTLGPLTVTIDRPNYVIPCNILDVNP